MQDSGNDRRIGGVLFDAVLFDCDGVLVDSERISALVLAEKAGELEIELDREGALALAWGIEMPEVLAILASKSANSLPQNFEADYRARVADRFRTDLKKIPGIEQVLKRLDIPYCVVSNGPRSKMDVSLEVTGLMPYFRDRIISAYEVGSFKPEPDVYLKAAEFLGVQPQRCAVVEDSLAGVRAGVAAGMRVFALVQAGHESMFAAEGAVTFRSMDSLPDLLGARA